MNLWVSRVLFVGLIGLGVAYLDKIAAIFIVGLVLSIMIHEWGHFVTARRFGMRADRFFLGFGPTVWSTQIGETEYGVKLLPLGGFVRIKGMTPTDERLAGVPQVMAERIGRGDEPAVALAALLAERGASKPLAARIVERFNNTWGAKDSDDVGGPLQVSDDPAALALELIGSEVPATGRHGDLHHRLLKADEGRFFVDAPAWQRAIVLGAGSFLHFVQAIVLIFLGWLLVGPTVIVPVIGEFADAILDDGTVIASAAEAAGLEVGDRLVAVAGTTSDDFEQLRGLIQENPGKPVSVIVERGDPAERLELSITPSVYVPPNSEDGTPVGLLGFFPTTEEQPMDADQALYSTFIGEGSFTNMLTGTIGQLGNVFGLQGVKSLLGQSGTDEERDPGGGISIVGAANAAADGTDRFGPLFLFSLLASVNVFVGVFNALPLPPLDGGHLAVLGVEEGVNARRRQRGEEPDFKVNPQTVASIAIPVIVFVGIISLGLLYLDLTKPVQF